MAAKKEGLTHLNENRIRDIYTDARTAWYKSDQLQIDLRNLAKTVSLNRGGDLTRRIKDLEQMKAWLKTVIDETKYRRT